MLRITHVKAESYLVQKVRVQERPMESLAVKEGYLNKMGGISMMEGNRRTFQCRRQELREKDALTRLLFSFGENRLS